MITDKKEIESVLQIGEKILLDHPELYNMSLDEVLVILDDGVRECRTLANDNQSFCELCY